GGSDGDPDDTDDAGEYVAVESTAETPLDLTGWTVEDEAGKRYAFPDGLVVPPGAMIRLYTGEGTDRVDLHWGRSGAVWNDDGDTASVFDDGGDLVAERSY
ncbi:lamin tail domain-containing protein, partial [Halobium palmae]